MFAAIGLHIGSLHKWTHCYFTNW